MTEHTQLAITPRDRFLEAAQKQLLAFERREREFRKRDRAERAAKLQLPIDKIVTNYFVRSMFEILMSGARPIVYDPHITAPRSATIGD